jgi:hypothetical protein
MSDESKRWVGPVAVAAYGAPAPPDDWKPPHVYGPRTPVVETLDPEVLRKALLPQQPDPEALMRAIVATYAEFDKRHVVDELSVSVEFAKGLVIASLCYRECHEVLLGAAGEANGATLHEALTKLAATVVAYFEPAATKVAAAAQRKADALETLRGMVPR